MNLKVKSKQKFVCTVLPLSTWQFYLKALPNFLNYLGAKLSKIIGLACSND